MPVGSVLFKKGMLKFTQLQNKVNFAAKSEKSEIAAVTIPLT